MRLAAEAQRTDKLILHPFTSYMPLGRTCGEHRTVSRRLLIFMSAFWNRPYIRSHGENAPSCFGIPSAIRISPVPASPIKMWGPSSWDR